MTLTPDDKQWISELLEKQLGQMQESFDEKLEKVETKLLTAFPDWSQPVNLRMRSHSADLRALQMEVEALQDRVTKLEERTQ